MRKRYGVAVAAVACLAVAGGLAIADPYGEDSGPSGKAVSGPVTVTLPTGDTVEVRGDSLLPRPAAGREGTGFRSTRLPGADRVIMPLDKLSDNRSDHRLYNVDALLRHGYTDAREVGSAAALGDPVTPSTDRERAKTTKVTIEYSWLDGKAPTEAGAFLLNLDTNEPVSTEVTDGKARLDLKPGNYSLVADMLLRGTGDEPWQSIGAVIDFKVTGKAKTVTVDGTRAEPVGVDLDAQATPVAQQLELFTGTGSTADEQITHSVTFGGADKLYAIPAKQRGDHPGGLSLQTELVSEDGASTYSLLNVAEAGIPADPSFSVSAADLAVRETDYRGLGGEAATVGRSNWGYHSSHTPFMYPLTSPARLETSRTEHYTAEADTGWTHHAYLPADSGDGPYDNVVIDSRPMEAGSEDLSWFSAPLSVRLSGGHTPYFNAGVERWPSGGKGELQARVPMFSGGQKDQTGYTDNLKGEWSVSLDGEELATGTSGSEFAADLPDDASGRFSVGIDTTRQVAWTPLGTRSTATWEFDSGPVEENTVLDLSAIRFNTDGVTDGYADASKPQPVGLDFETQPGAADRDCEKLGFEVSYDDGKTWTEVDIDRDGDHATATLEHPADAKFVSVRFNATDDRGQTVTTSTIRSYGLN